MSQQRRVRITSDGTSSGTRVTDLETGGDYAAISLAWEHASCEDFPVATLRVVHSVLDVEADARIYRVCASCGDEDCTREADDLRDVLATEKELRLVAEDRLRSMAAKYQDAIAEVVKLRAAEKKAKATMGGLVSLLGWRGNRG